MEIEERKQKVPGDFVKRFRRFLSVVLETSIVSQRNCIIWIFFVLQQFDFS